MKKCESCALARVLQQLLEAKEKELQTLRNYEKRKREKEKKKYYELYPN